MSDVTKRLYHSCLSIAIVMSAFIILLVFVGLLVFTSQLSGL